MEKKEQKPFSDPERMRRGMRALSRTRTVLVEGGDGRMRAVSFQAGTNLVARSVVIPQGSAGGEAVEKLGLNERQLKGLGVPPDTRPGDFLDDEPPYSDPL